MLKVKIKVMAHAKDQDQGHGHLTASISRMVTERENINGQIKYDFMKSIMGYRLVYLNLTLAYSKGELGP